MSPSLVPNSTSIQTKKTSSNRQSTSKSHLQASVSNPNVIEEDGDAEDEEQKVTEIEEEQRKLGDRRHHTDLGISASSIRDVDNIHSDGDCDSSSLSDSDVDSEGGRRSHRVTRGISDLDSDNDDFGDETDLECDDKR